MINKVILVGNVGMDPEVRTLETGTKVARLRLATTERVYNKTSQETKEYTEWHTVVLWGGLADVADKYIRKGSRIYVEGTLRSNEWTDKEGNKRYSVEIIARELKLLDRKPAGGGSSEGQGYSAPAPSAASVSSASSAAAYSAPAPSASDAPLMPADDPDDLPF